MKQAKSDFMKPQYFRNRELSWLDFNYRVLHEARDKSIPLLERTKFLSITASNLDEFFMVRVASLKDMVNAKYLKPDLSGLTPGEQLIQILKKAHELVNLQYSTYNRSLLPTLKQNDIIIIPEYEKLNEVQSEYVDKYFEDFVYPVLTPMAVDSSRPFPLLRNKTLNIAALLKDRKKDKPYDFATVQVPSVLPRIIPIPSEDITSKTFILLEQVIEKNIQKLFLNYEVKEAHPYRIMRNADLSIDEEEAADLLSEIENKLKKRKWGEVIRLEVEEGCDSQLLKILTKELKIKNEPDIFYVNGPIDLTFLMKLSGLEGFDHLRYEKYIPKPVPGLDLEGDIFEQIRSHDYLLNHPYYTFDAVVEFVRKAAFDPNVLAIKQTLYRVSSHSPIIASLATAAENGKQVTVLVELKARFDEENNINWAKKLEKAGCHVIYGLVGLKTHCKITLIVRKEEDGIRRYVHLGTGNYNDSTAKLYTDLGILTCKTPYGEDATAVFNMLSGYSEPLSWHKLSLAPIWLRDRFMELIERETAHAKEGKKAVIIAKMNSLCDAKMIAALYEASAAGVEIHLIIRGICCLKVGMEGISETITVRSIVGNFLEHARIYYFYNDGFEEVYMSSADLMPRNLDRRVEIMFPIEDEKAKSEVLELLDIELKDTVKAHILTADGTYEKIDKRGKVLLDSQEYFCKKATEDAAKLVQEKETYRVFEPLVPPES
ncbi:MAG: RNA degradosome polyphosphate kinase [bacterium]|nr:RNA degradosome polyphosphate kinase [bacterium]